MKANLSHFTFVPTDMAEGFLDLQGATVSGALTTCVRALGPARKSGGDAELTRCASRTEEIQRVNPEGIERMGAALMDSTAIRAEMECTEIPPEPFVSADNRALHADLRQRPAQPVKRKTQETQSKFQKTQEPSVISVENGRSPLAESEKFLLFTEKTLLFASNNANFYVSKTLALLGAFRFPDKASAVSRVRRRVWETVRELTVFKEVVSHV